MNTRSVGLLVMVWAWAASASAQEVLKPRFEEGTQYKASEAVTIDQTLNVAGNSQVTKNSTKVNTSTVHGKRSDEGELAVTSTVESIVADLEIGGAKYHFDSTKPEENNQANDPVAALVTGQLKSVVGMAITYTLDADNKVQSVEGLKEGTGLDPDELKTGRQQEIDFLPAEPLKPGDTWERVVEESLGGGQTFTSKRRYRYEGLVDKFPTVKNSKKLDKITAADLDIVYSFKNPVFKVTKSDLQVKSSERTMLFDRELGRVVDSKSSTHVTGAIGLDVMGMTIDATLDLKLGKRSEEVE